MDEILYELREHSAGLNCGRWDYIFSFIKTFRNQPGFVLPDRAQVTMDASTSCGLQPALIRTCHRRGAHAMGGMAAQIPIKGDARPTNGARKVRADKLREVLDGHDGTWVAHPASSPWRRRSSTRTCRVPTRSKPARRTSEVDRGDLLAVPKGTITEAGLRTNVAVGVRYLEAWLRGSAACRSTT